MLFTVLSFKLNWRFIIGGLFIFLAKTTFSKPIFISTSSFWENNRFFIGNCVGDPKVTSKAPEYIFLEEKYFPIVDMVYRRPPDSKIFAKLEGYQSFALTHRFRDETLFVLANRRETQLGILYQLDPKTHREINQYILPMNVSEGSLVQSDVFYENAWHTILILTAIDAPSQQRIFVVFDVTDSKVSLKPFIIHDSISELLIPTAKPVVLRLKDGQFLIALGGHLKGQGILQTISFNGLQSISSVKVNGKALTLVLAVDLFQQAIADQIYLSDGEHFWGLATTALNDPQLRRLADIKNLGSLVVLPNTEPEGVRLYVLGETVHAKGLFMIEDPLWPDMSIKTPQLIQAGDYHTLWARFGRLWLIPKKGNQIPLHLILPMHLSQAVRLKTLYSSGGNPTTENVIAQLIWDPKTEAEILLTMNLSCQLNVSALSVNKMPYGRILQREKPSLEYQQGKD